MVGHDYVCVQKEFALRTIVLDGRLQKFGVAGDLEEPTALRGDGSDEIRSCFLWS